MRSPARLFALVFGIVYLVVGVAGFPVTGFDNFASSTDEALVIFPVNPLHNIVHLALGVVWLVGSRTHDAAKSVNLILGVVLGFVTVLGFIGVLRFLNIDSLADPDNFLHLVTAALSLYFGSAGAEGTTAARA